MASILSAGTTTATGLNFSADTTGILQLASNNGTVGLTIDTSQNVGIGTSSPLVKLHVSTSGNTPIINETTGGTTSYFNLRNTGGQAYIASNNNALVFAVTSGATEAARIDSSGNLGIGTSSPAEKLNVVGGNIKTDASSRQIGYWEADTIHDGYFIGYNSSGQSELVNSYATGGILFKTGNSKTERMRIDSSGNVGIGTNAPISKLNVNGGTGDTTATDAVLSLTRTTSTGNVESIKLVNTEKDTNYGNFVVQIKTTASGGESPSYYTNALTLDGQYGSLGLGVTPSAWIANRKVLAIGGLAVANVNYAATIGENAYNFYYTSGGTPTYQTTAPAAIYDFNNSASGGFAWKLAPSGTAGTTATFTQAMTLDSSGNLGIGTSSPAAKLDVVGPASVTSFTGTTKLGVTVRGSTAATDYSGIDFIGYSQTNPIARIAALTTGSGSSLSFGTSNSYATGITNTAMTIDYSGNLLVGGITSPSYSMKMTVSGGISSIGANQFNIAGTTSGSDFEWVLRQGSRQLFFVTNATVVANLSATGVWTNASDARYKENIVDSQYGLSTVMALKPRAYNLINQTDKPQIGFIAQEVLEVIPEVVESVHNAVTEEDRYTLSYGNMVAVLTKAIQEQQALITQLQADVAALKAGA